MKLEDWYIENNFTKELNVNPEDVRYTICSFDMFLAYNRQSIIRGLKRCLDNSDDGHSCNFYSICSILINFVLFVKLIIAL